VLKADAEEADRQLHREVGALLRDGRLVHIEGAGHVIRLDRASETEREIRAFLATLAAPE
jgi:pimeloyl-ACP methyl ester carboxylesterase